MSPRFVTRNDKCRLLGNEIIHRRQTESVTVIVGDTEQPAIGIKITPGPKFAVRKRLFV